MTRLAVAPILISISLVAIGCESPQPTESVEASGFVELRIGDEEARLPFGSARCWSEDGRRFALGSTRTQRTRAATDRTPDVLVGRVSEAGTVTATAFQFGGSWSGESYDVLAVLGEAARGVPHEAKCGFETREEKHRIRCQNATPVPWQSPGGPPRAEFVAEFECEFGPVDSGG